MIARHFSRLADDHYWTLRLVLVGTAATVLSMLLGGLR